MDTLTKVMIKNAFLNCGLATAFINGIISYLTLAKVEMFENTDLVFNFLGTAIGCGIICPFFSGMILKNTIIKKGIQLGDKKKRKLAKWIPNNLLFGALMIGLFSAIFLWMIPYFFAEVFSISFSLSRINWCICLGLYSGIAAAFSAYFGVTRAYYARFS